jgi:AAA ATPase domain
MRLARFSVENYRGFNHQTTLELRPLTLFFGYNSAGKSALLRFLPIIAASSGDQLAPLALDSPAARGASFRDVLSRSSSSPTMRLGLEWTGTDGPLRMDVGVRDVPERQLQVVEDLRIRTPAGEVVAVWNADPASLLARTRAYEVMRDGSSLGVLPLTLRGLVPEPRLGTLGQAQTLVDEAADAFFGLSDRVHWLNSLRAVPPRVARFGAPPTRLSHDGLNAGEYLAHDVIADRALIDIVSAAFAKITNHQLDVKRYALAGEEQYSLLVSAVGATPPVEVPVVDTGEGMAQLLPVVVLGALAKLGRLHPESVLAIEHPELHLHPAAHAALAEFFCELASADTGLQCIIETHSENLLLRVQIAIAKGELAADKVIVHWVRTLPGGSGVDTITFDDAARPQGDGWPPGVFSEDMVQARELLRIRKHKGMA